MRCSFTPLKWPWLTAKYHPGVSQLLEDFERAYERRYGSDTGYLEEGLQ